VNDSSSNDKFTLYSDIGLKELGMMYSVSTDSP